MVPVGVEPTLRRFLRPMPLPIGLRNQADPSTRQRCDPGRIRTPDLLIRNQPLCPTELRNRGKKSAPRVGFEPTRFRLTAGCSAAELPRNTCAMKPTQSVQFVPRVAVEATTFGLKVRCSAT